MAVTTKYNGQREGGIKMRYELSNETTIEKTDERQNEKTFGDYFSEFMTTEEIFMAWSDIQGNMSILQEAVNNRLEELGFDEEQYIDGENPEIEQLLGLRETLYTVSGL